MNPGFVHLNLHSEFSLVDGILRIGPLIERARALGMPAVAVTDRANLFCMVRFYRAAVAGGIKPIIGVDLPLEGESNDIPAGALTLLAMDRSGYRELTRLLTRCYMAERGTGLPAAARTWVEECSGGIIAISPGPGGDVGQALLHGRAGEAERRAEGWASAFPGRFYLGVQRTSRTDDAPCLDSNRRSGAGDGASRRRRQRRQVYRARRFRGARSAGLYPRRPDPRRSTASEELQRRAVPEVAPGNGGIVRGSSRGPREHGRDRTPVQPGGHARRQPPPRVPGAGGPRPRRMARRALAGGIGAAARRTPARRPAGRGRRRESGLHATARHGARGHQPHGVSGVFSHRGRFHRMGEEASDTGRAGARLRGRIPRRLRPRHHRPRPSPLRPALRTLPESRARVAAGLRRRLLHGRPGPGHRLRRLPVFRRPRRPDHHLRDHGRQSGGP